VRGDAEIDPDAIDTFDVRNMIPVRGASVLTPGRLTADGQTSLSLRSYGTAEDLPRSHRAARHMAANAGRLLNLTVAKRNYLVEGLSGVGKTSVYEELIRRGYTAINTDLTWGYHADPETGLPSGSVGYETWLWDQSAAVTDLEGPEPEVLFVCGSCRNSDRFQPYFTRVFNLCIDDDTMRRRLEVRTDDDWPLGQDGVELMLELNRSGERLAGATDVDATRPLDQVVEDLLRLADLDSS
jgi:hypothetical protein